MSQFHAKLILPRFIPSYLGSIMDHLPTRYLRTREFAYFLDNSPTGHFTYGHCKNRHLAISTAAISLVITQFLLYIVLYKCINYVKSNRRTCLIGEESCYPLGYIVYTTLHTHFIWGEQWGSRLLDGTMAFKSPIDYYFLTPGTQFPENEKKLRYAVTKQYKNQLLLFFALRCKEPKG